MARSIPARMMLTGTAHRIEPRIKAATESVAAHNVANVIVLTEGGGFAEVYLDGDHYDSLPAQGAVVLWTVDVDTWSRPTSDGQRRYTTLFIKLVQAHDVPQASSGLAAVAG